MRYRVVAHSIGQTSCLTSVIRDFLYNGDHLVPLGLWLPIFEAVASGPDLCRWQGLLGLRLRDALTVCLGLQGEDDPCIPLSTSFFRALVLVLWSDQHILQGGKREAGGGGQVAMASKHSVPGAVRLQRLPHPPQLGPHSCTLPAKVSILVWGLCFQAWGSGTSGHEPGYPWTQNPISLAIHGLTAGELLLLWACRSKDPANYTVKVGVQNLPDNSSELLLTNIVIHEKFNNHMSNDIAILKLKYPVPWSPLVQPICLPTINFRPTIGTMCWVVGWGKENTKGEYNRARVLGHLTLQDTVLGSPTPFFLYSV